jgi:hypothetical protein
MGDRLYKVVALAETNAKNRLIKAGTKSQVANHLVSSLFTIEPASPLDVAEFFAKSNGKMEIENAGGEAD